MSRDGHSRADPGQAPSRSRAARQIDGFERRFGRAHVDFACHAAIPVALTAELAYKLWATFPVDTLGARIEAPWIAVADLLLSDLCTEIAPELYEVRPGVRKLLVARLRSEPRFGEPRLREVATFLLEAAESRLRGHDPHSASASLATSQRWAALAYTDPARAAALIADAMKELSAADPAAWARLDALLTNLSEPLADHAALSSHAAAMASFARGNTGALAEHVRARGPAVSVAGRVVEVPREALSVLAGSEAGERIELHERRVEEPQAEGAELELRSPSLRVNLVRADEPHAEEPVAEAPQTRPSQAAAQQLGDHTRQGTEAATNERPLGERLTVFVIGTDHVPLAEELRPTVEALGGALARAGHTLLTGGGPGIDEMVARAFVDALPPGEDSERRLLQLPAGRRPPTSFSGGGLIQFATGSDGTEALVSARAVVAIGGGPWTMDLLQRADQMGRPTFPLRWTGGSARDFKPLLADEVPLWHSRRVRGILGSEPVVTLPADRWLVPVIELANPAKARAFREYNDLLADFLQVLDPVITFREVVELKGYWAELAEAGSGGVPGSRMAELAAERLVAIAAQCPVWIFHDLAQLSMLDSWDAQKEARRVLIRAAARHARPHIADITSAAFRGRSPPGLTDETRELLLAVRAHLAGPPDQRADGEPDRETAYLHWLRPIVAAWSPVVLAGTVEMSERGNSMVEALRAVAPEPSAGFLKPLLESMDRNERVAGYLWTCAFPAAADMMGALEVALSRETIDADSWGTPWALLCLARAAIAIHESAVAGGEVFLPGQVHRGDAAGEIEEVVLRLERLLQTAPELDPRGRWKPLIHALIERLAGVERPASPPVDAHGGTHSPAAEAVGEEPFTTMEPRSRPAPTILTVEQVFVLTGYPQVTYVEPVEHAQILAALLVSDRGLVVEGQTASGKSVALRRGLETLGRTFIHLLPADPEIDSLLRPEDVKGWVVIDDVHCLDRARQEHLARLLRNMADRPAGSRKLILLGRGDVAQTMSSLDSSLTGRFDVVRIQRQPDVKVEELLAKGERALNITFEPRSALTFLAMGNLALAQELGMKALRSAGITRTMPETTQVRISRATLVAEMLGEMRFALGEELSTLLAEDHNEPRGFYLALVWLLSRHGDLDVSLTEVSARFPWLSPLIDAVGSRRLMLPLVERTFISEVFRVDGERVSVINPRLSFYLRHESFTHLTRAAGLDDIAHVDERGVLTFRGRGLESSHPVSAPMWEVRDSDRFWQRADVRALLTIVASVYSTDARDPLDAAILAGISTAEVPSTGRAVSDVARDIIDLARQRGVVRDLVQAVRRDERAAAYWSDLEKMLNSQSHFGKHDID